MAFKTNRYMLLAFDPGGTLGWAMFSVDLHAFSRPEHSVLRRLEFWDCGEFSGPETGIMRQAVGLVDYCLRLVSMFRLDVLGEDFDLTQLIGDKKNLLSPVRQNAVMEWECAKRGVGMKYQSRTLRTNINSHRLNAMGFEERWTTTGKGKDKFAAMQHGVTYLRRLKKESKSRPWKLDSKDIINGGGWDCSCEGKIASRHELVHPM